jgi:hypothetical protein
LDLVLNFPVCCLSIACFFYLFVYFPCSSEHGNGFFSFLTRFPVRVAACRVSAGSSPPRGGEAVRSVPPRLRPPRSRCRRPRRSRRSGWSRRRGSSSRRFCTRTRTCCLPPLSSSSSSSRPTARPRWRRRPETRLHRVATSCCTGNCGF